MKLRDLSKLQQEWANSKTRVSDVFKMEPGTDRGTPRIEKSPDERKQVLAYFRMLEARRCDFLTR